MYIKTQYIFIYNTTIFFNNFLIFFYEKINIININIKLKYFFRFLYQLNLLFYLDFFISGQSHSICCISQECYSRWNYSPREYVRFFMRVRICTPLRVQLILLHSARPELFLREITGHYDRRSLLSVLSLVVASSLSCIRFSLQPWDHPVRAPPAGGHSHLHVRTCCKNRNELHFTRNILLFFSQRLSYQIIFRSGSRLSSTFFNRDRREKKGLVCKACNKFSL